MSDVEVLECVLEYVSRWIKVRTPDVKQYYYKSRDTVVFGVDDTVITINTNDMCVKSNNHDLLSVLLIEKLSRAYALYREELNDDI